MAKQKDIQEILKPYLDKLTKVTSDADKILLDPKGEEILLQLLKAQEEIDKLVDLAKVKLETAALKLDPNFSSVQADKIKVFYRAYGQRFYVDENNINMAPKELYEAESKVTYKVDAKAVEKWVAEHGGMPTGIIEVERKKSLSFSLKNNAKTE